MSGPSRALLLWLVAGSLAVACTATDRESSICTEIGCRDQLTITLKPKQWRPGDYLFRIQAGDKTVTCRGALPLPACGKSALSCDDPSVTITESGCAQPSQEHGFEEILINGHLDEVEVGLEFDGKQVVRHTSKPVFRTTQPNGPECEPTCRQGAIRMKIPPLRPKLPAAKPDG